MIIAKLSRDIVLICVPYYKLPENPKKQLTNPQVGVIIDKKQIHSKLIVLLLLIEIEVKGYGYDFHYPAPQELPVRPMSGVISSQ